MIHHTFCPANPNYIWNLGTLCTGPFDLGRDSNCSCDIEPTNERIYNKYINIGYVYWGKRDWQGMFMQGRTKE